MNIKKTIKKNKIKLLLSTILWTLIGVIVSKTTNIFNLHPLVHTIVTIFMVESINISLNYGTIVENKYLRKRLKQENLDYIENETQEKNEMLLPSDDEKQEELNKTNIKPEEITPPNNIIDYEIGHEKVLKKKLERKVKSI